MDRRIDGIKKVAAIKKKIYLQGALVTHYSTSTFNVTFLNAEFYNTLGMAYL
jgi:DNA polymerase III epsilon subunit-like protein